VRKLVRPAVCLWAALRLISCGLLIDIPDRSGITYCPEVENQVLSEQESPSICFDFEVNRSSVEALFSIKDAVGYIPGEYRWESQTVSFQPQAELIPGRRYLFYFFGTYNDYRGGEYYVHRIVPFYYKERGEAAPYVVGSAPTSGQTIAAGDAIHIRFSEAIDPSSLGMGLSIKPDTPVTTSWENGSTELVLIPQEKWNHCQCYEITLTEELRDDSGIPLAEAEELVFWVQGDIESPRILSVQPGLNLPSELYPWAGYGIEERVDPGHVLRILFTEEMDTGSTTDALSVHPSRSAQRFWIDAACLVVVPDGGFQADTEYVLDFDAQATDLTGNTLSMPEPIRFTTIPGEIEVVTELVHDGIQLDPGDYSTAVAIEIQPYPISSSADYELLFHFSGSQFDSNAEKYSAQQAISLVCVFPDSGVSNPIATGYSWMGDLLLSVTYSELQPSTVNEKVYYLLRIRGGPNGIATDEGRRLPQDLEQLLLSSVE
jgi:hypothetical protein